MDWTALSVIAAVMLGAVGYLAREMQRRLGAFENRMDARFDAVDRRFEASESRMDARFDAVDRRFEQVDLRFDRVEQRIDGLTERYVRHLEAHAAH